MNQESSKRTEPLRGTERLEWARVSLEEAVERMVKNTGESVYIAAVCARWKELDELRAGLERRHERLKADGTIPAPKGRLETMIAAAQGKPVPEPAITTCPNCRRFVVTAGQHFTGTEYMCTAVPAPTEYKGIGRPRKTDFREG